METGIEAAIGTTAVITTTTVTTTTDIGAAVTIVRTTAVTTVTELTAKVSTTVTTTVATTLDGGPADKKKTCQFECPLSRPVYVPTGRLFLCADILSYFAFVGRTA